MSNAKHYMHTRTGDVVEVKIKDASYRVLYKNKFNINDRKAIMNLIGALEKFSGFSITELLKERLRIGEWI